MRKDAAKELIAKGKITKIVSKYEGIIEITTDNINNVLSMIELHNDFEKEKNCHVLYIYDKPEQQTVETAEEKKETEDKKEYTLFINDNFTFTVYEIEQGHQLRQVYSYGVQRLENLYDVYWELDYDNNTVKCYLESEHRFIDADLFIPLIWVYKHTKDDEQQLWKDRFKENKYTAIQKAAEIYQAFQIAAGADLVREEMTE